MASMSEIKEPNMLIVIIKQMFYPGFGIKEHGKISKDISLKNESLDKHYTYLATTQYMYPIEC